MHFACSGLVVFFVEYSVWLFLLDALSTMQRFSSLHLSNLQKSGAADGYINADLCRSLLVTCSEEFEAAKVHQLCDFLCQNGFVKEDTFSLANQVMIAYIKK